MMDGVAGCAGNAILVMGRTHELALLSVGLVAGQATLGDCFRASAFEDKYLALVAAALNVGRPGTMARFAPMNLFAPDLCQVSSVMRTSIDTLELIFVAALASFGTNVLRTPGCISQILGVRLRCRRGLCPGIRYAAPKDQAREGRELVKLLFYPVVKNRYRIRFRL
jgi:hypothetical protein